MKRVVSVSLDEKTISKIDEMLVDSSFRNKSHLVEEAVKRFCNKKETRREGISELRDLKWI